MKLIIKKADFEENSIEQAAITQVISSYSTSANGKNKGTITNEGTWSVASNYSCLVDVSEFAGGRVKIDWTSYCYKFDTLTASAEGQIGIVAFLKGSPNIVNGQQESNLIGSRIQKDFGSVYTLDIPNDAVYLYVYVGYFPTANSFSTTFLPKQIVLMK